MSFDPYAHMRTDEDKKDLAKSRLKTLDDKKNNDLNTVSGDDE